MRKGMILALSFAIAMLSTACSGPQDWTDEEKQNIQHYLLSAKADIAASRLLNLGAPYTTIPKETTEEYLRLKKTALEEARRVRDDVLDKALPGMSTAFRQLYQRGLEMTIRGLEDRDTAASIEGSKLHDQWVNWVGRYQSRIKIPK